MSELISDTKIRLESFIQNNFPDVDIAPGTVISELIIKLAATLQNPITNDIDALSATKTVTEALAAPSDTYSQIIDNIASNFNTVRNLGVKSEGKIKVTVSSNKTYYVNAGTIFFQPVIQLNYITLTTYRITANPTDSNDLQLFSVGGSFYFYIPVEAQDVGTAYQVSDQMPFTLDATTPITGFVQASAYGNFTSGISQETDKQLINRFQLGLTNKSLLNAKSIKARLSDLITTLSDVSVVGVSSPELTRSKHNVFGISTLGMSDVYVRTTNTPNTIQFTETATKLDNVDQWSVTIDRDAAPGFYKVLSIIPADQTVQGTLVYTPVYSYDLSNLDTANLIYNLTEARFTRYQTCTLTFTFADSSAAGTTKDFLITVSGQPNISDIQDLFLSNDERIACADYLVRSALPCFVSLSLKLHKNTTASSLPVDTIKQDIYNYINSIKFGESLYVSSIVKICHNYDIDFVELPINLSGSILCNDGSTLSINSSSALTIPTNLALGVSSKTTLFFAEYYSSVDGSNLIDSIGVEVI